MAALMLPDLAELDTTKLSHMPASAWPGTDRSH